MKIKNQSSVSSQKIIIANIKKILKNVNMLMVLKNYKNLITIKQKNAIFKKHANQGQ